MSIALKHANRLRTTEVGPQVKQVFTAASNRSPGAEAHETLPCVLDGLGVSRSDRPPASSTEIPA